MKVGGLVKKEEGLTLTELLVVVSILGVLVGLVATGVTGGTTKSRAASFKEDQGRIQAALGSYYGDDRLNPQAYPTYGIALAGGKEFYIDFGYLVLNNNLVQVPGSASSLNGATGLTNVTLNGSYGWIVDITNGKVRAYPDYQQGRYP